VRLAPRPGASARRFGPLPHLAGAGCAAPRRGRLPRLMGLAGALGRRCRGGLV